MYSYIYTNPDNEIVDSLEFCKGDYRSRVRKSIENAVKDIEVFDERKYQVSIRWGMGSRPCGVKSIFVERIKNIDNKIVYHVVILDFKKELGHREEDVYYTHYDEVMNFIDNQIVSKSKKM